MENAFGETIRALGLLSVRGTYFVDAVMLNGGAAALAYDFFEDCVEETVGELEAVNVRLDASARSSSSHSLVSTPEEISRR